MVKSIYIISLNYITDFIRSQVPGEKRGPGESLGPFESVFRIYSHSTNSNIGEWIYYDFTRKTFANMLIFYPLFWTTHFLSIKIVSQKPGDCKTFSLVKMRWSGQALLGLARLDYSKARPGGAVNDGVFMRRSSRPLTASAGVAIQKISKIVSLFFL